ncbi:MAG TPA: MerR family transcriptional regulator [Puia sp.]|nr:MerR family transcriptional regulator [Puia sp.]
MTTFSQISMKFVEESTSPQDIQLRTEDQPLNIGVRIKKLKSTENQQVPEEPNEPTGEIPMAEPVDETQISDPVLKLKSGRGRKSIRQVSEEADLIQIPEDEILFQKQYYTMGEVAEMFRVNQSLLRFWEAEFNILQPKKNKKGDRYFRPVDIKNLHLIYHLLRQRKYTIEGAKDFLKKNSRAEEKFETIKRLEEVRHFLLEMKANLK